MAAPGVAAAVPQPPGQEAQESVHRIGLEPDRFVPDDQLVETVPDRLLHAPAFRGLEQALALDEAQEKGPARRQVGVQRWGLPMRNPGVKARQGPLLLLG